MTSRSRIKLTASRTPRSGPDYSKPEPSSRRAEQPSSEPEKDDEKSGLGEGVLYPPKGGIYKTPRLPTVPGGEKQETRTNPGLDSVLASALAMSPGERKQLLARLSLAQNAERAEGRDLEMWVAGVSRALAAAQGHGAGDSHAVMLVRRVLGPSQAWEPVAEFLARSGFDKLEVTSRQSVLYMLASLLVKYAAGVARNVGAPLTPKFVAGCSQHVAAVFDNAFPGYLAAGLAPLVARRLVEGSEAGC